MTVLQSRTISFPGRGSCHWLSQSWAQWHSTWQLNLFQHCRKPMKHRDAKGRRQGLSSLMQWWFFWCHWAARAAAECSVLKAVPLMFWHNIRAGHWTLRGWGWCWAKNIEYFSLLKAWVHVWPEEASNFCASVPTFHSSLAFFTWIIWQVLALGFATNQAENCNEEGKLSQSHHPSGWGHN